MKLKIEDYDREISHNPDREFHLVNDGTYVAHVLKNGSDNPAYVARLFQSAEELLELAQDRQPIVMGGLTLYDYHKKYGDDYKTEAKLINYVKTGDKDDMVTVKCDGNEIKMKKRSIRKLRDALDNLLK